MTNIIINSEDDMERGIMYAMELAAVSDEDQKRMEISFPSKRMMDIFMSNLFVDFYRHQIPIENSGIDLVLSIPPENNNGGFK